MIIYNSIYIITFFFISYSICKLFGLMKENAKYSRHKKLVDQKKEPIILGGIFFLFILIFNPTLSFDYKIVLILITLLGILSDKNILPSPRIRLIFQIILLFFIIDFEALKINDLRNDFLNEILSNNLFNIFFVVFCMAILINGSNFLDGLNGLLVGYYLSVLFSIFFLNYLSENVSIVNNDLLEIVFISLLIFYFFNIMGYVYLGDSGSYLVSFVIGLNLVEFYSFNSNSLSPFYIACLLWYPAYENFFSILRRIIKRKELSTADNLHLHQVFFLLIKSKKKINKNHINSLTAFLIILINLPSFFLSTVYFKDTSYLISILLANIVIYNFLYYLLIKKLSQINLKLLND